MDGIVINNVPGYEVLNFINGLRNSYESYFGIRYKLMPANIYISINGSGVHFSYPNVDYSIETFVEFSNLEQYLSSDNLDENIVDIDDRSSECSASNNIFDGIVESNDSSQTSSFIDYPTDDSSSDDSSSDDSSSNNDSSDNKLSNNNAYLVSDDIILDD